MSLFRQAVQKSEKSIFPVALCRSALYNRQKNKKPDGYKTAALGGGGFMNMLTALNSILALGMILVLVILVRKQNHAFGHARSAEAM